MQTCHCRNRQRLAAASCFGRSAFIDRDLRDPRNGVGFSAAGYVIHEKARLAIMTLLAARADWPFQDLKAELKMSDGNLVTHLRTLHQTGYIAITKAILDRPQTSYALTVRGRAAFGQYLGILEKIVQAGRR